MIRHAAPQGHRIGRHRAPDTLSGTSGLSAATITRRTLLAAAAAAVIGGTVRASMAGGAPVALIYRGPAASPGCPESVARLIEVGLPYFTVRYCGPDESHQLTAETFADGALFVQPGGTTINESWPHLADSAPLVRSFVAAGGTYLGFCLGAYLATERFGYGIVSGKATRFANTNGSQIDTLDPTLVQVSWRGQAHTMFFQDGPQFLNFQNADVLARYRTGAPAAIVTRFGKGSVGLVGPHPEADASWFSGADLPAPAIDPAPVHDLVSSAYGAVRR